MPMPPLQTAQNPDVSIMHVTAKEESPHLTTDPPLFLGQFMIPAQLHLSILRTGKYSTRRLCKTQGQQQEQQDVQLQFCNWRPRVGGGWHGVSLNLALPCRFYCSETLGDFFQLIPRKRASAKRKEITAHFPAEDLLYEFGKTKCSLEEGVSLKERGNRESS